uniref:Uncharacterized protein n=1 Tax=Knipowitschia caucasica TaxID=637954 RepID=A0AAV2K354_KNICA
MRPWQPVLCSGPACATYADRTLLHIKASVPAPFSVSVEADLSATASERRHLDRDPSTSNPSNPPLQPSPHSCAFWSLHPESG